MMEAALDAVGLADWRYQLLPLPPDLVGETILALPQAGFRGVNVTIPHKSAALGLADAASPAARSIGAANTLLFEGGGEVVAENTDAPALIAALPFSASGRTALVLGAGGSARATVWALLDAGAAEVRIWNRRPDSARQLAAELGATAAERVRAADLLVNCTPVGMAPETDGFKALPVAADELAMFECVVDFAYGEAETSLVRSARSLGVPVTDGLDLLVGQGALSFERFTAMPAPVDAMRAAARER
jgi:shikimate dehydrogenase